MADKIKIIATNDFYDNKQSIISVPHLDEDAIVSIEL